MKPRLPDCWRDLCEQEIDKILGEHAKVEQGLRSYNQRILAAIATE